MSDTNPYESSVEPQNHTGNMTIFSNLFTAPSLAMTQVQQRYNVLFPLFVMILMTALVMVAYFVVLDYAWYLDFLVETTAGELSKAEQDQQRSIMEMMSKPVMGSIAVVTSMVGIAVIYVIQAVYFLIVSNVNNDGYQFKQWFSFISWTAMPALLAILAMFVFLFSSSNGQIAPDSMNPLSLNELFFGLESSKGLGKLLSTIHLPQLWSFAVMVIGYQSWTKSSTVKSAFVVLTPFVLIYLGWYLFFV